MTTRERKLAKAERLRGWADKREAKADAILKADATLRSDLAFVAAQPGIGRAPIFRRTNARQEREYEHRTTAASMDSRAAGIEDQASRAIYSDDTDAIDALRERIAGLEAQQARMKTFNTAVRKNPAGFAEYARALEPAEVADLAAVARYQAYYKPESKGFPPYALTNLGANIRRNKERLAQIERQAAPGYQEPARYLYSVKYAGTCRDCGASIERGAQARYYKLASEIACYPACNAD